ncbi:MAG: cytidine deaminase [Cytophagales bacterium]|nr:cytidine deaminase [Cytophagales bacterium]
MHTEDFKIYKSDDFLDPSHRNLVNKAREASQTSYSPYSNFQVGAALILDDGQVITGSNQENASYPAGLCAERVALFYVASQQPDRVIKAIATVAKRRNEDHFLPVSPCGICRQVLLEYELKQKSPIQVILQSQQGEWVVTRNSKILLPFCFERDHL